MGNRKPFLLADSVIAEVVNSVDVSLNIKVMFSLRAEVAYLLSQQCGRAAHFKLSLFQL